jgi:hypothetical protein
VACDVSPNDIAYCAAENENRDTLYDGLRIHDAHLPAWQPRTTWSSTQNGVGNSVERTRYTSPSALSVPLGFT